MRSRPCRSWFDEKAHHLPRTADHRLEHQLASAVDHGNPVLASIACGGIQDTAVSEGSTHPHLRAPEVGALTPCLVILPRSFLPRAFKRFARSFQRCLDRGDLTLKLPLHPPAHEGQRQPQRPGAGYPGAHQRTSPQPDNPSRDESAGLRQSAQSHAPHRHADAEAGAAAEEDLEPGPERLICAGWPCLSAISDAVE
jgi:hypothetical protein